MKLTPETMPVDVLAVMDPTIRDPHSGAEVGIDEEMAAARAAVAEMVEAARAELDAEDDNGTARERLAAALVKFGGAA